MLPETTSAESELPVWVIDEDGVRFSIRFALLTHNFNAMTMSSTQDFLQEVDLMQPGCLVVAYDEAGQELQDALNRIESPIKLVFLANQEGIRTAVAAMEKGAISFLEKPVDPDILSTKIARALKLSLQAWRQKRVLDLMKQLSRREAVIFELICQGYTNSEIARQLFISQRTVETHRLHISRKMEGLSAIAALYELARGLNPDVFLSGHPKTKRPEKSGTPSKA